MHLALKGLYAIMIWRPLRSRSARVVSWSPITLHLKIWCLPIITMMGVPGSVPVQAQNINFDHLSIGHGGYQDIVTAIIQDSRGFMWFGTEDGLYRYDGYTFTAFNHNEADSTSLLSSVILGLCEGVPGEIWIASGQGVSRYTSASGRFSFYTNNPTNPHSLSSSPTSLYRDSQGRIWICTLNGGLNLYDRDRDQFIRYRHDPGNPISLSNDTVHVIFQDKSSVFWIGTAQGVDKFDPDKNRFERFRYPEMESKDVRSVVEDAAGRLWFSAWSGSSYPIRVGGLIRYDPTSREFKLYSAHHSNSHSLSNDIVYSMCKDSRGVLWVGTGNGLNRYDSGNDSFFQYHYDPGNPASLSSGRIYSLYEDRSGIVWIGTYRGGLNLYDRKKDQFVAFTHRDDDPQSLCYGGISAVYEDKAGTLWVGADGGLSRYDAFTNSFVNSYPDPAKPFSISDSCIKAICEDQTGGLWIGSEVGGLNRYDRSQDRFIHFRHEPGAENSLSLDVVHAIIEDRHGNLWIGTHGGGLDRYDRATQSFVHYRHDPADPYSLGHDYISTLFEDNEGQLWIGTFGAGLDRFDRKGNRFTHYRHVKNDRQSLSNDIIVSIAEDSAGNLWLGTWGGGLNRYGRTSGIFTSYTEKDSLAGDFVKGILSDNRENFWLSTNKGISKFDPRTHTCKNYDKGDGLPFDEFASRSCYKAKDGRLFFGGWRGLVAFYPDSITDNQYVPPIVITMFKKFEKDVKFGNTVADIDRIELSYQEDFISFEFAALDFRNPQKNQYAYMMEGFDQAWIYSGTRRYAAYTHLDPGEYVFRVKGSNNDGIWNEAGTSIKMIITPPYWKTVWFKSLALLIFLSIGPFIYYRRVSKLKNEKLTQEEFSRKLIESQEAERKRVAAELHDSLGQNLLIVNNELQQYVCQPDATKDDLQRVSSMVRQSIDEVREIAANLHPHHLDRLGLRVALEAMIEKVSRSSGMAIHSGIDEVDSLFPNDAQINVYRIVQEALSNIVRHSGATSADILLRKLEREVQLTVSDNGKGLDPPDEEAAHAERLGFGISSMTERVKLIGGTLAFGTKPGGGVTVHITIPVSTNR